MKLVKQFRPRLSTFAREHHELDPFVMSHNLSLCQAKFFQVIVGRQPTSRKTLRP